MTNRKGEREMENQNTTQERRSREVLSKPSNAHVVPLRPCAPTCAFLSMTTSLPCVSVGMSRHHQPGRKERRRYTVRHPRGIRAEPGACQKRAQGGVRRDLVSNATSAPERLAMPVTCHYRRTVHLNRLRGLPILPILLSAKRPKHMARRRVRSPDTKVRGRFSRWTQIR